MIQTDTPPSSHIECIISNTKNQNINPPSPCGSLFRVFMVRSFKDIVVTGCQSLALAKHIDARMAVLKQKKKGHVQLCEPKRHGVKEAGRLLEHLYR